MPLICLLMCDNQSVWSMILIPSVTEEHLLPPDGQCSRQQCWICYDLYFTWTGKFTCESHLYLLSTAWKTTFSDTISAPSNSSKSLAPSWNWQTHFWCLVCPCHAFIKHPNVHALDKSELHAVVYISMLCTYLCCVYMYILYICILWIYVYKCVTCAYMKAEERSMKKRKSMDL